MDDQGAVRPFPLHWPFLHDLFAQLEEGLITGECPVIRVEKSRRLIVTTALCVWIDWHMVRRFADLDDARLHFDNPDDYVGLFSASVTIKNEPDAKKVITRARKIHLRMPDMLRRPYAADNALNLEIEGGGQLWGLNAGGHAARLEGYAVSIMDEAAFQPNASENYRALRRCSKLVVIVSTANGKANFFYDIGYDPDKSEGVQKIRIHYTDHPERRPTSVEGGSASGDRWYARESKGTPQADWDREQEILYDVYAEPGLFSVDWAAAGGDSACVQSVVWDQESVIDIAHDPGYWRSAIVVSYNNFFRQRCVLKVYLGKECTWDEQLTRVYTEIAALYPGAAFRLVGDPAAHQNKTIANEFGENKDVQVCQRIAKALLGANRINYEYHCDKLPKHSRVEGHRMVRRLFYSRGDNKPGLLVDKDQCGLLLEAVRGGYRFPENATDHQKELEMPNRTSDHVHIVDAFRYCVVQFTIKGALPIEEPPESDEVDWAEVEETTAAAEKRQIERGIY